MIDGQQLLEDGRDGVGQWWVGRRCRQTGLESGGR